MFSFGFQILRTLWKNPGKMRVCLRKSSGVFLAYGREKKRKRLFFSHGFRWWLKEICVLIDHLDPYVEREKLQLNSR